MAFARAFETGTAPVSHEATSGAEAHARKCAGPFLEALRLARLPDRSRQLLAQGRRIRRRSNSVRLQSYLCRGGTARGMRAHDPNQKLLAITLTGGSIVGIGCAGHGLSRWLA